MTYFLILILPLFLTAVPAHAEENPELHILPDGAIHILNVELWQKHTSNVYSVKAWGLKWRMEIPYGLSILSAQNVPIKLEEVQPANRLEIKGKMFTKNYEHFIEPSYVRNLSIQTPEAVSESAVIKEKAAPSPAPTELKKEEVLSVPVHAQSPIPKIQTKGLTMILKKGYRGGQVSLLQKFLAGQGLISSTSISGYFGEETEKALKKFQKQNGLETVGTTGPKTRALINGLLVP